MILLIGQHGGDPLNHNRHLNDENRKFLLNFNLCGFISDLSAMGLLPDTKNCGLRMRGKNRERFPRHQL